MMRIRVSVLATVVALVGFATAPLLASPIVTVQPINICDDAGTTCSNPTNEFWAAAGNKIWAQAGITLNVLPWTFTNHTAFMDLSDTTELNTLYSNKALYGGSTTATVLNIWFSQWLNGDHGYYGVTGCAGAGNCIIDIAWSAVFPLTRLDTIAHEIGHALGLGHFDYGAGGADNLMTQGSDRTAPSIIGNINPDGLKLDKLTADQIRVACGSSYVTGATTNEPCGGGTPVVPEPGTMVLVGIGLSGLARRLRKRAR